MPPMLEDEPGRALGGPAMTKAAIPTTWRSRRAVARVPLRVAMWPCARGSPRFAAMTASRACSIAFDCHGAAWAGVLTGG